MKFYSTTAALIILLLISCNVADTKKDTGKQPGSDDSAIKKAVDDAYGCISFKQGEKVNYENIKTFFVPQAQLINFRNDTMQVLTIDRFVEFYKSVITDNSITSFYEEEITGTTEQFGRIGHRISTYKTYINNMDSVTERGVNSFQLIKTNDGWKVSSIIWDIESPKLKIPDYYLKSDSAR